MKKPNKKSGKKTRPGLTTKKKVSEVLKPQDPVGMRLNKYVAHAGICSRRQAAEEIKKGKVTVNGNVVLEPFYQIKKGDKVAFDGKPISPEERLVYILMNKPKNVITTNSDELSRTTVMDIIGSRVSERIFPVGRLDRDTTGLLLLTNDGDLAKKLTHPSHKVKKVYKIWLDKPLTRKHMQEIGAGLELEDGKAMVDRIGYASEDKKNEVLVELHIGKNRVVRRIFESLGYTVDKLDRIYFGGLTKKDLPRGNFRFLTEKEVIMLRHFS